MNRSREPLNWIDDVLDDSFPASDPPSWTPGMVRPEPAPADGPPADRKPWNAAPPPDREVH